MANVSAWRASVGAVGAHAPHGDVGDIGRERRTDGVEGEASVKARGDGGGGEEQLP